MPELPEVETIVRQSRELLVGRRINRFESRWPRQLSPDLETLVARIDGARIAAVTRRAKFIVLHLTKNGAQSGALLIHLRMSGRFEWSRIGDLASEPAHVRATFDLDDGCRLFFCDARKFGRIAYSADPAVEFARLGPEPLDPQFTASELEKILGKRHRRLKPLLLDQAAIAGLGNIYTDEALYHARLHPLCDAASLNRQQIAKLHKAIRRVLKEGIARNGTSIDWVYPEGKMQDYLAVYGRAGKPCKNCGETVIALRVAQRGTHLCPQCQPAGMKKSNRHKASRTMGHSRKS